MAVCVEICDHEESCSPIIAKGTECEITENVHWSLLRVPGTGLLMLCGFLSDESTMSTFWEVAEGLLGGLLDGAGLQKDQAILGSLEFSTHPILQRGERGWEWR